MKITKIIIVGILTLAFVAAPVAGFAADAKKPGKAEKAEKADKKSKDKYPLDTCVVSGEKLGEMGDPYVFKHNGKEVKLCCKSCLKDFKKDPDKFMKKIDEAAAKKETK